MSPRGRHPHNFARAGAQQVAAALKSAAAAKAAQARPPAGHPIPLPVDSYSGDRRTAERERRASGYTSLRVSKRTRELLELVTEQARRVHQRRARAGYYSPYYSLGVDELLYWDALERLGQLPPNHGKQPGR